MSSYRFWLGQEPGHVLGMKFQLHDRQALQGCEPWGRAMTHPHSESLSEADRREIPSFIESASEVVPARIVVVTGAESYIVVHFSVLAGVDS
jgi:hypothetical protein